MKKNWIVLFCLLSVIGLIQPKKSEAGLLIGTLAGNTSTGAIVGGSIGGAWFIAGTVTKDGPFTTSPHGFEWQFYTIFFVAPAVLTTLLDIDAALPEGQIVEVLKKELYFIDNTELLQTIAAQTKQKAIEQLKAQQDQVMISFSESEISQFLRDTDLSEEQHQHVVDLLN